MPGEEGQLGAELCSMQILIVANQTSLYVPLFFFVRPPGYMPQ